MADLPSERSIQAPPFTYTGMDAFGPFFISHRRSQVKRYGVLFTCLASRAIHIEMAKDMSTDSFINAYRRFTARRGPVRELRSDCGSNFQGASGELKNALNKWQKDRIRLHLVKNGCDFQDPPYDDVRFSQNPPYASHFGGVWERLIRNTRNVLSVLLKQHGLQLDDDSLHTFLCEAESIVNSRPLSTETVEDTRAILPISPSNLLTLKTNVTLPPPGIFDEPDVYARKHWKRVQFLANRFWSEWRAQYLMELQKRQKETSRVRNLAVNDIVTVADPEVSRIQWPLARITEVN